MIFAIDPGNTQSAYVIIDENLKPIEFGKIDNKDLLGKIYWTEWYSNDKCVIEMVASYGMPVGETVFDTVFWIGRFYEAVGNTPTERIYRKDVKMNLCHTMKAKDSNIRQALIDRFGEVGTKKKPGWFYGFKADIWQAYAVGVTYHDIYLKVLI